MNPDELENLIRSRRSSLLLDAEKQVANDLLLRVIDAAQFAPNHRRTWPLRVAAVTGATRFVLGNTIADAMAMLGDDEAKVTKARTKYLRSPVVLVVASAQGSSENETEENKYAVAAGIQNMLLMAHSLGLAALWGSPAKGANEAITRMCGFETSDHVMGLVYVGWPTQQAPSVERPPTHINYLD
jgi:nitroreductase